MATRVSHGRITVVSSNSLYPKASVRYKDRGDIYYTFQVIAHFVSNFVAMATGVGQG